MISKAVAEYPNFKVAATTLRARHHRDEERLERHLLARTASSTRAGSIRSLEILDRVGGGDSFASGLIYGFLKSNDPQKAVDYGAAHGALAMTTPGDTSMATLQGSREDHGRRQRPRSEVTMELAATFGRFVVGLVARPVRRSLGEGKRVASRCSSKIPARNPAGFAPYNSRCGLLALTLCLPLFLSCWFSAAVAYGDEEVCVACDRKVVVSGQFSHGRGHESLAIEGAPRRGEEAFREEIQGTNFTVSVPDLPEGRYTVQVGLAEVDFMKAGERVFDITCGDQVLATNLDVFAAARGAGKVYFITATVEHPGDALRGPLTCAFLGRTNMAKLNTFEVKDSSGRSLVSLRAADLISAEEASVLKPPVITGPEIWKDPSRPTPVRVTDLVSRLSLAEKVQQMRNDAPAIPRLGVPAYNYWSECLHGVARAGVATVFPQAIGMAAAWDEPLLHEIADVIATEGRAKHHEYARTHNGDSARYYGLTFWTPNINIFRDPRWGRGQETYGEDPYLTAQLGVAFIRGLQGDDPKYIKAMACAKHFAVHSGPESERHRFNVVPSERDLYETYLPQFEAAVREGHVGAVMGAYNRVNGEPACSSTFLLTDLLRKQWGFTGHVVSDCGAIYDIYANHKVVGTSAEAAARAVKAGCDLCCGMDYNSLTRAVQKGLISEKEIDTAVGRLFEARFRLGLFDPAGARFRTRRFQSRKMTRLSTRRWHCGWRANPLCC